MKINSQITLIWYYFRALQIIFKNTEIDKEYEVFPYCATWDHFNDSCNARIMFLEFTVA